MSKSLHLTAWLAAGLLSTLAASPLGAQVACGDSLLAKADTAGAIADCEALGLGPPESAEARYRAGRLLLNRYLAGATTDADRDRAERHFRRAIEMEPDSARYVLGLAEVQRTKTLLFDRMQVNDLVDRALALAEQHGSGELANIEYRGAVVKWEQYEQLANRYQFISDVSTVDPIVMMNEWKDALSFFELRVRPMGNDPGGEDRQAAEEHLHKALSADPRHVDAAGLLVVLLLEGGDSGAVAPRKDEAIAVARGLVRAAPDSGRAWAVLGMALARNLQWVDAQAAFDTALRRMTPEQARPYQNLAFLLKGIDQAKFGEMSAAQQAQLDRIYWAVSQPLFLTQVNEVQVEFFTRLTYVIHRWSDPFRRLPGYDSDRGSVYLRWGPPDIWASFGRGAQSQWDALSSLEGERNTIFWLYRSSQLRFMFSMTPGFGRTTFSGDFRTFYNEVRDLFPARFDNVPVVADMDTILVQFAQFRGEDSTSTELGVFTFMPIGRMARGASTKELELQTAAILRDGRMRDVQRDRRTETIPARDSLQVERRSFRFEVPPKDYLLRVEARLPAVERAARSTSALRVRSYGTDSLMMSDVLVAERVAPRDSTFQRWTDFLLVPSAGRFVPNDPVGLLWEIYNLQPDSSGTAHYTVDVQITVRNIERPNIAARILGGLGDAMEYLMVQLENAPLAEYAITVRITDRVRHTSVEALRRIVVTDTPLIRH
jgi:GWxTD domain-containing protein